MGWTPNRPVAMVRKAQLALILIVTGTQTATHAQDAPAPAPVVSLVLVATGLVHPWAVAFLPGGQFLVTERPGRLRVVSAAGRWGLRWQGCRRWQRAGRAVCWTC